MSNITSRNLTSSRNISFTISPVQTVVNSLITASNAVASLYTSPSSVQSLNSSISPYFNSTPTISHVVYVSITNGNDNTGDGSLSLPFQNIKKAMDSIKDASPTNLYSINIDSGIYKDDIIIVPPPPGPPHPGPTPIVFNDKNNCILKPYVFVTGQGRTTIIKSIISLDNLYDTISTPIIGGIMNVTIQSSRPNSYPYNNSTIIDFSQFSQCKVTFYMINIYLQSSLFLQGIQNSLLTTIFILDNIIISNISTEYAVLYSIGLIDCNCYIFNMFTEYNIINRDNVSCYTWAYTIQSNFYFQNCYFPSFSIQTDTYVNQYDPKMNTTILHNTGIDWLIIFNNQNKNGLTIYADVSSIGVNLYSADGQGGSNLPPYNKFLLLNSSDYILYNNTSVKNTLDYLVPYICVTGSIIGIGSNGYLGSIGPTGYSLNQQGPTGNVGIIGSIGATGERGSIYGSIGITGSIGQEGYINNTQINNMYNKISTVNIPTSLNYTTICSINTTGTNKKGLIKKINLSLGQNVDTSNCYINITVDGNTYIGSTLTSNLNYSNSISCNTFFSSPQTGGNSGLKYITDIVGCYGAYNMNYFQNISIDIPFSNNFSLNLLNKSSSDNCTYQIFYILEDSSTYNNLYLYCSPFYIPYTSSSPPLFKECSILSTTSSNGIYVKGVKCNFNGLDTNWFNGKFRIYSGGPGFTGTQIYTGTTGTNTSYYNNIPNVQTVYESSSISNMLMIPNLSSLITNNDPYLYTFYYTKNYTNTYGCTNLVLTYYSLTNNYLNFYKYFDVSTELYCYPYIQPNTQLTMSFTIGDQNDINGTASINYLYGIVFYYA